MIAHISQRFECETRSCVCIQNNGKNNMNGKTATIKEPSFFERVCFCTFHPYLVFIMWKTACGNHRWKYREGTQYVLRRSTFDGLWESWGCRKLRRKFTVNLASRIKYENTKWFTYLLDIIQNQTRKWISQPSLDRLEMFLTALMRRFITMDDM